MKCIGYLYRNAIIKYRRLLIYTYERGGLNRVCVFSLMMTQLFMHVGMLIYSTSFSQLLKVPSNYAASEIYSLGNKNLYIYTSTLSICRVYLLI